MTPKTRVDAYAHALDQQIQCSQGCCPRKDCDGDLCLNAIDAAMDVVEIDRAVAKAETIIQEQGDA